MLWPNGTTTRPRVSSAFGPRKVTVAGASSNHMGVDMIGFREVRAIAGGRVMRAGYYTGWSAGGLMVWIDHGAGLVSRYLHLASAHVRVGDEIPAGAPVGVMGKTGATAVHLHLEVVVAGRQIDPVPYIEARLAAPAGAGAAAVTLIPPADRRKVVPEMFIISLPNYGQFLVTTDAGADALTGMEALAHRRAGVPATDWPEKDENGTPYKDYLDLLLAKAWKRAGESADRLADRVEETLAAARKIAEAGDE